MDATPKNFNQLSSPEKLALVRGPYGRELLKTIAKSTAVFEWETDRLTPSRIMAPFSSSSHAIFHSP
jgi:hypothetical protein